MAVYYLLVQSMLKSDLSPSFGAFYYNDQGEKGGGAIEGNIFTKKRSTVFFKPNQCSFLVMS